MRVVGNHRTVVCGEERGNCPFIGGASLVGLEDLVEERDLPQFLDVVLRDLDRQLVINLNDQRRTNEKYPGLKVGSLTETINNAGNWE